MIELAYPVFREQVEKSRTRYNQDVRVVHYSESDEVIIMYLRSVDYWEYYTIIDKRDIYSFGQLYHASPEQAVADFKMSILHNAIPVLSHLVQIRKDVTVSLQKEAPMGEHIEEEEAEDYVSFLRREFRKWEDGIMHYVDTALSDEVMLKEVDVFHKTFGEFLRGLLNTVNTFGFFTKIKSIIKRQMIDGLQEAEAELNMDIGVSEAFTSNLDFLTNRQLEGFHIEGGKWNGIKGVASELQQDIAEIVRNGLANRAGLNEIKSQIKEKMTQQIGGQVDGEVTEGRAMRIARTETNRFRNSGRLRGYKDSGIVKKKRWNALLDMKTSEVCKELHGQEILLNEMFFDKKTGMMYDVPPAHPNCRSVIEAVIK